MCPRNILQCRFIFTFDFLANRHYILLLYKPLVGVGDNHHPENNPIFWVFVTQSSLELILVKLKCTAIQHQGEEVWLLIEWQQEALLEPNNRKRYTLVCHARPFHMYKECIKWHHPQNSFVLFSLHLYCSYVFSPASLLKSIILANKKL